MKRSHHASHITHRTSSLALFRCLFLVLALDCFLVPHFSVAQDAFYGTGTFTDPYSRKKTATAMEDGYVWSRGQTSLNESDASGSEYTLDRLDWKAEFKFNPFGFGTETMRKKSGKREHLHLESNSVPGGLVHSKGEYTVFETKTAELPFTDAVRWENKNEVIFDKKLDPSSSVISNSTVHGGVITYRAAMLII